MARRSCGVAADEGLREVGDHEAKPHHTQQDLRTGNGKVSEAKEVKCALTSLKAVRLTHKTDTHLKESRQDCEGTCDLYSVSIACIDVHSFRPISAIHNKVTVRSQPFGHTPNHDADHSKCA